MVVEIRDFSSFTGWRSLIEKLVHDIDAVTGNREFRCVALKERFGACRILFVPIGDVPDVIVERVRALTRKAEIASDKICVKCGQPGRNFNWGPMWISALCRDHARQTVLEHRQFPQGEGWTVTAEFRLADQAAMPLKSERISAFDARASAEEYEKDGTLHRSKFASAWYAARLVSM
ncbi:MAG: hypothetical protein O9277_02905 [Magnetospirillum sp.]|nr:hypothetical protein [Magnetospirillum sp.]